MLGRPQSAVPLGGPASLGLVIDESRGVVAERRSLLAAWSGEPVPVRVLRSRLGLDAAHLQTELALAAADARPDADAATHAARLLLGLATAADVELALGREDDPLARLDALRPWLGAAASALGQRVWLAQLEAAAEPRDWERLVRYAPDAEARDLALHHLTTQPARALAAAALVLAPVLKKGEADGVRAAIRTVAGPAELAAAADALARLRPDADDAAWAVALCADRPGFPGLEAWARARVPLARLAPRAVPDAVVAVGLSPHRRQRGVVSAWSGRLLECLALLDALDLPKPAAAAAVADGLRLLGRERGAPPLPLEPALLAAAERGGPVRDAVIGLVVASFGSLDGPDDRAAAVELLDEVGLSADLRQAVEARIAPPKAPATTGNDKKKQSKKEGRR